MFMVNVAKYTSPMDTMGVEDLDSVWEKKSQHHQMITAMKLEDLVHFSLGQTEGVMV